MKIGSILFRCYEFDRMLAFWREALHYVHGEPVEGGFVILHDSDPGGSRWQPLLCGASPAPGSVTIPRAELTETLGLAGLPKIELGE